MHMQTHAQTNSGYNSDCYSAHANLSGRMCLYAGCGDCIWSTHRSKHSHISRNISMLCCCSDLSCSWKSSRSILAGHRGYGGRFDNGCEHLRKRIATACTIYSLYENIRGLGVGTLLNGVEPDKKTTQHLI